eukprot:TRINITY_DN4528_c1_g1_i1.p1 TRINITY_DN4528_c1_g1~~TRINITY_DN4528_c1_g1_i1.p1  ORF type:complete len:159 (+),score=18.23 TRINITY_DN4528_c1_g1_i1:52-477(+)
MAAEGSLNVFDDPVLKEFFLEFVVACIAPIIAVACWKVNKVMYVFFNLLLLVTFMQIYLYGEGGSRGSFFRAYVLEFVLCLMPIIRLDYMIAFYIIVFVLYFYRALSERILLKIVPNMIITIGLSIIIPMLVKGNKKLKRH